MHRQIQWFTMFLIVSSLAVILEAQQHRMGAPFLIGETHATTHVELQAASKN
jgi:hypothetical protein